MVPAGTAPLVAGPTAEEIARNWPQFRGPGGLGIAAPQPAPLAWDAARGTGLLWKTEVPLPGNNSPVVWEDRVFLSGAEAGRQEVYCFDAATGKLLWKQPVTTAESAAAEHLEVYEDTGYAPATMATDGQVACAMFPTGDVAGFDYTGKLLWARNFGPLENAYGHASSLALHQGRLFLQLDQGWSASDGRSELVALDAHNGQTLWRTKRASGSSWASPIVVNTGQREEVILAGNPILAGYDPVSGAELWHADCLGGEVAPSPAFAGGRIFAANLGADLTALAAGLSGEIPRDKFLWTAFDNLPDIASPLATEEFVFVCTTAGMVTCYDAAKGTKLWEHSLGAEVKSSPTLVGSNVYLLDTAGVMHIFAAARQFKAIGTGKIGEGATATPAYVGGKIFIRGKTRLYCVGAA